MPRVPCRGDIVWVSMSPRLGHEQAGRRPALVLSPESYNAKVGLAILCPITGHVKGYPFEVAIPEGLQVAGVVLSDQIRSVDWREREAEFICPAPTDVTHEVLQKIGALVGV